MARLGRIPEVGDKLALAGHVLRVDELDGMGVAAVRLVPAEIADPTAPREVGEAA